MLSLINLPCTVWHVQTLDSIDFMCPSHGLGLHNTSPNLFYLSSGEIVYYMAAVGIVYSPPPLHKQRFFLGHNDDIRSIAICASVMPCVCLTSSVSLALLYHGCLSDRGLPAILFICRGEVQHQGVTYPARTLVATGQVRCRFFKATCPPLYSVRG